MSATRQSRAERLLALTVANQRRFDLKALKLALSVGSLTAADVLRDPPECVSRMLVPDVMCLQRGVGADRLRRIGIRAVADGVNLLVTVERASVRTRCWAADELELQPAYGGYAVRARAAA